MNADAYYRVLRDGTPEERRALLDSLPDTGFGDMAGAPLLGARFVSARR